MNDYMVLAVNPGSTSTKISVYNGDDAVFVKNIKHAVEEVARSGTFDEEVQKRKKLIMNELNTIPEVSISKIDAFVGRGGGFHSCATGTYEINDQVIADCKATTLVHPGLFAPAIAYELAKENGKKAYSVDPPTADEFIDEARITGLKGCYREPHGHPLNQKEVAHRAATEAGKKYEEMNFVVAHLGGGITVSAHRKGKMIDSTDAITGDGPMSPTRCGSVPALRVMDMCFSGEHKRKDLELRVMTRSGLTDYLGISDGLTIENMFKAGDKTTVLVYNAMLYQIAKFIGAMAAALEGKVDFIILTGGLVRDKYVVEYLQRHTGFIAPVKVYPGEFEMEALTNGVLRVLRGQEKLRQYTGEPVFSGFDWDK